jgi:hypothetical protein
VACVLTTSREDDIGRSTDNIFWRVKHRLPPRLLRFRYHLAAVVLINLVLLGAYLWSRGGQTTHVRLIANGDTFEAYVDGRLTVSQTVPDAPERGGLILTVENTSNVSSLPQPRGLDSVSVRDLSSRTVLFQDEFDEFDDRTWTLRTGRVQEEGGVLAMNNDGSIALLDRQWTDVVVDVKLRNVTGASVAVRAEDAHSGISFGLRPFRHYDSSLSHVQDNRGLATFAGARVETARSETIKSLVEMTLRPYPIIGLFVVIGLAIALIIQALPVPSLAPMLRRSTPTAVFAGLAVLVAIGALGVSMFLMVAFLDRMPHDGDTVAYVFQAKIFASGHLVGSPPIPEVFEYNIPSFFPVTDGNWASVYPFGHPLMLSMGEIFGSPWVIPPLLGALCVLLTFELGRRIYGPVAGLAAAILLASSPFFLMQSSSYLSHSTAVLFMLLAFLCLVFPLRPSQYVFRPLVYGVLAGLSFGMMLNTQTLSAVALTGPIAVLLMYRLHEEGTRRIEVLRVAGFVMGGLVMLGAYLVFNYLTRGGFFESGFTAAGFKTEAQIGFGGDHSVSTGIQNEQVQMSALLLVLNGWPAYLGLLFPLLSFALGSREPWDWFFLTCVVVLIAVYALFIGSGIMLGPRYWYPAVPLLLLLTARGAQHAASVLTSLAVSAYERVAGRPKAPAPILPLAIYGFIAVLVGGSISSWLLSRDASWHMDFLPNRAVALQSFYNADDRLINLIDEADLKNALVVVRDCRGWPCYGTVFWLNEPTLDGDVVIAREVPQRMGELLRAYPDRGLYLATYQPPTLVPFGVTPPPAGGLVRGEAPRAGDVVELLPAPSPTPTAVSDAAAIAARDMQRVADIATLSDVLQQYYLRHGRYPEASAVQSICRYRELDAACVLVEIMDPLPQDPIPSSTYYYRSGGSDFTLFAAMEAPADDSQCPPEHPPELAGVRYLYCVRGQPESSGAP